MVLRTAIIWCFYFNRFKMWVQSHLMLNDDIFQDGNKLNLAKNWLWLTVVGMHLLNLGDRFTTWWAVSNNETDIRKKIFSGEMCCCNGIPIRLSNSLCWIFVGLNVQIFKINYNHSLILLHWTTYVNSEFLYTRR